MSDTTLSTTVKMLAAFVAGSALGLATGLMLAPTTGKQARKKLGKQSKKLAKKLSTLVRYEQRNKRGRTSKTKPRKRAGVENAEALT